MIRLLQEKTEYVMEYKEAVEFANGQMEIFWLPDEIDVEKDLQSLKTVFNEAEYHGVVSTLKLFTLYEVRVGGDYWGEYINKVFKRPDIQRMANVFSFMEVNVHAPFYNRINEVLGLDNEEFYNSYLADPILKNRMEWIGRQTTKSETLYDILSSIAIFSMIEGAILFSSFAFLKHFNNNGKNKLTNVNAGINFSIQDEQKHSEGGAWLFRTLLREAIEDSAITEDEIVRLKGKLEKTTRVILEHEGIIISKIFEHGTMKGITDVQLNNFVQSRLDICLTNLGFDAIYKPTYNPIAKWIYNDIQSSTLHDFFNSVGSDYHRNWSDNKFEW